MPPHSAASIAETLRERALRGLRAGTLGAGSRLPSARELVAEFNVDSRVILVAYRELAADGLVEIRERGGVYIRAQADSGEAATLPVRWFADTFAEALARGISANDVTQCLRRLVETMRLRAIVISTTEDQAAGLARELREDFGLVAEGFPAEVLADTALHAAALKAADVFIAAEAHAVLASSLADKYGRNVLTIEVRPDLIAGEWATLLRQPVWAVVTTVEGGELLKRSLAGVGDAQNLNVIVYGRDDLEQIPPGVPTYLTHLVREALGVTAIRGRILPPARTISTDSARQIFEFIVRTNYRAQPASTD